jgi:hypothetical protein
MPREARILRAFQNRVLRSILHVGKMKWQEMHKTAK